MSKPQDKNFEVRLRAAIDKKMTELGLWDCLLKGTKDYEHYKELQTRFFDSLTNIIINHFIA